jgi:NitT/TauT family transport system substrate-binding protein
MIRIGKVTWKRDENMKTRILTILFLVTVILTACAPEMQVPPDQVTVQLKWVHQAQFAGFYTAEAQGYYAAENIDVTFVPGGVGIDIFEGVSNGDVAFSVVGADSLMVKRAEGLSVTAIATIYRVNPFILVAFADSGITSPQDFIGRTVALTGGYDTVQFKAMLINLGIDASEINIVEYTYDDTPFLDGEIDVNVSFAAGSLLPLKEKIGDRELNLIWPGDYGVHFYSDTLIANDELIAENPDLVLRFLRATLKGHRFAIENPEVAIDASMQYAKVQDRDVQAAMLDASIPLIHTGEGPIGWMETDAWQRMQDILLDQRILDTPLDLNQLFTMEFLESVYETN